MHGENAGQATPAQEAAGAGADGSQAIAEKHAQTAAQPVPAAAPPPPPPTDHAALAREQAEDAQEAAVQIQARQEAEAGRAAVQELEAQEELRRRKGAAA